MSNDGGKASRDTDVSGTEAVATGKKTYSDKKIKDVKKQAFIESGADDIDRKAKNLHPVLGAMSAPFQAGSIKTRTYFDEKVLTGKRTKQNIGYTQEEFRNLSLTEQNKVYDTYMSNRMSGKTDAYGNPTGGWRKENVRHKNKDGTYTTKEVWMGGNDNDNKVEKSNFQLEQENAAAEAKKDQANEEQADYSKKKRLSVKSSRSLFANEGGRGFFN
jgi:hypothetical protein